MSDNKIEDTKKKKNMFREQNAWKKILLWTISFALRILGKKKSQN